MHRKEGILGIKKGASPQFWGWCSCFFALILYFTDDRKEVFVYIILFYGKKMSRITKKWFWNKWCRWWDLNPHGIATNGFWVRRVCHSTTPANYLIIILYERQKIKPFFESFFQKQEFFLHMIWTVADYIRKENIFVWLLFLWGKLWYNIHKMSFFGKCKNGTIISLEENKWLQAQWKIK